MPDIRSFFGPKGGAAPAKPAPKKVEEPPKARRGKGRKVLDDSDDDDVVVVVSEPKKSTPKTTPKKKAKDAETVNGVATTTSDYFASSKAKAPSNPAKAQPSKEVEIRSSPPNKLPPPSKSGPAKPKTSTVSHRKHDMDDDEDAYVDDEEEDGDDIFSADAKGRNKRKNDDYAEEDSEGDSLPRPKRAASRGRPPKSEDKPKPKPSPAKSTSKEDGIPASKKRKSPRDDPDEELSEDAAPRKKPATSKPRAPRATKKADDGENPDIQAILDSVATVRAPTPPAQDPNVKFDWRKTQAGGGGNSGPPPNAGEAEIPEGADNCLAGMNFVFTGLLKTIGRDEAQNLVKRYGGKVTGAPSSKTSFVVLGDDAGPSKLKKIREHGIKTIDESGLFDLIRKLPANGGSSKAAGKVREKQEADQAKIKKQAAEMENEEKTRQAEAVKAQQAAGARGATSTAQQQAANSALWTTKYAPTQLSHICGNKSNVEKIQSWLKNWPKAKRYDFQKRGADGLGGFRAIMISGPPGIGKTTAAHLAARLEGYDVLESNASDTRSKKLVENGVSDVLNNTSLLGFFAGDGKKVDTGKKKIVLIMDEVDGMSAGDRGGVGALAKFCKKTEVPLILICNERRLPKMKPFDFVTLDVKFTRPTVDQIRSRIMTIAHREGLKMPPSVVDALIEGSGKDIRQIINMISTVKLDQTSMDYDQSKSMSKAWEKHVILKPWDICQKMISGGLFSPASKSTLNDKIELYFNDHDFSFLMIQENYLRAKPMALTGKGYNRREENLKHLELIDQAAESISDGDLVDRMIHGPQQHWSLMPTHAVFSTVRPSRFIAGQLMGSTFTSWLGHNSKTGRLGRLVREIHSHMRLRSSGDHNEIRQQYLPVLWYQTIARMSAEGKDAVEDIINLMDSYYLTRDDFDAIKELGVGPQNEELVSIESQTKAAFTRTYNAMSHPIPFMKASNVQAPTAAAKVAPDLEEAIEEEDEIAEAEPAEADVDEDMDIKDDKYIKKPKAKKPAKKTAKAKDADAEDLDDDSKPAKSKAKGKAGAGKGKGKK